MKVLGTHITEEGVEIALFYIDDRHQGLAVGPQTGPEETAGVLVKVKAKSEEEAKEKLSKALQKGGFRIIHFSALSRMTLDESYRTLGILMVFCSP